MHQRLKTHFFFDPRYPCAQKTCWERTSQSSVMSRQIARWRWNVLTPSSPPCLPLQVYVDVLRQIGHALHLCLLLWPERLLQQKEEEEKGASGGREGWGGRTMEGSGDGGVTAALSAALSSPSPGFYLLKDRDVRPRSLLLSTDCLGKQTGMGRGFSMHRLFAENLN